MSLIGEFKFVLRKKIDSLHSPSMKDELFGLLKSDRIGDIKSLAETLIRNPSIPHSDKIQLARDIKKYIEIWRIGKKWEEAKKRGELD